MVWHGHACMWLKFFTVVIIFFLVLVLKEIWGNCRSDTHGWSGREWTNAVCNDAVKFCLQSSRYSNRRQDPIHHQWKTCLGSKIHSQSQILLAPIIFLPIPMETFSSFICFSCFFLIYLKELWRASHAHFYKFETYFYYWGGGDFHWWLTFGFIFELFCMDSSCSLFKHLMGTLVQKK